MQIQVDIAFDQLLKIVKTLPSGQLRQLKAQIEKEAKIDKSIDLEALLLNGPVATFVLRRISKPFRGGYYSANKQFIAPLPIPIVDGVGMAAIAAKARALQEARSAPQEIARLEAEINADLYQAYRLTESVIALVERG